jgi:GT2 family glycosyltransferase
LAGDNHSDLDGAARFAAIAIGRNEGERLKSCIRSLAAASQVIYVDSGSSDGSAEWAREQGAAVIELDMSTPFTAARARNTGFRHLRLVAPEIAYVHFLDGDCELVEDWPAKALRFLECNPDIGAVCGRRRERFPRRTIYNWLCDLEWDGPAGEARSFGGDVMIRSALLERVGGYRDDVIAGEEPELCVRLRAAGSRLWRLPGDMTIHDAAMTRFGQWWRRMVRSGYAFAQGADLHGAPPERHFVWESRRAWIWGAILPLVCLSATLAFWPWGLAAWLVFPAQVLRQTARNSGPGGQRALLALFQVLTRFAETVGQFKYLCDRKFRRQAHIIEYK